MLSNSKLNVTATLDTLLNASKNWEENSRNVSNATLYGILTDCLRFYEDLLADVKARKELNTALSIAKITFTASTDLATKIVRYVFRTEAKRAYVYSRVLKLAHEQKVAPLDFTTWVTAHDGIDAITKAPKNGVSPAKQNEADRNYAEAELAKRLPATPCLTLPTDYLPNKNAAHSYSAAILRKERDGTISVVYAVNNESLVASLLAFAGRSIRKSDEAKSKKAADVLRAAAIEEIASEAIAQLRSEAAPVAA